MGEEGGLVESAQLVGIATGLRHPRPHDRHHDQHPVEAQVVADVLEAEALAEALAAVALELAGGDGEEVQSDGQEESGESECR